MDERTKIFTKVASRLNIRNTPGNVVSHVALLKRIFDKNKIKTTIMRGFCYVHNTKEVCNHYWLRDEFGVDFDISFEVAKLKNPLLMSLHVALLEKAPIGIEPIDKDETEIISSNKRLYELLKYEPEQFWLEAPVEIKSFKI